MEIVQIIKALGDENSIRVLNLLRNYELCSGEIEYILKIPKSKVISNLNKLYRFKIIIFEKGFNVLFICACILKLIINGG